MEIESIFDCNLFQEVVWNYGTGVAGSKFFSPRNEKFLWYVNAISILLIWMKCATKMSNTRSGVKPAIGQLSIVRCVNYLHQPLRSMV